jgi:hypothetical protein
MQNSEQVAKERLIKFKESQRRMVKSNDYEFKEIDLVHMKIEKRQKLDPL